MSIGLPGSDGALQKRLEAQIEAAGRTGVSARELAEQPLLEADAAAVETALAALAERGLVAEWNGRWLALSQTDWVAGTLQVMERGDALLRSGAAGEPGYFIAKRHLSGGRDGDLVLARPRRGRASRQAAHRLPAAAVFRLLTPRTRTIVGRIETAGGRSRLVPLDPRFTAEIDLPASDLPAGTFVVAALLRRSGAAGPTRVEVHETLGTLDDPGVDVKATLRHFEIPDAFPVDVSRAAETLPSQPTDDDVHHREDLTGLDVITIDGETAQDFDDAISLESNPDGRQTLGVHIADVAHYVEEGSVLDLEAYRRGTSVYFPDRAVPMLPERLSNGLCSLRPQETRLALSVFLDFSAQGELLGRRFARTAIRSQRRMTYVEVRRLLEEPQADDRGSYGDVLGLLHRCEALMRRRLAQRLERGSIDFDLPEGDVILDLDGAMVGVRPGERNVAHRIIEEFMIAANEAAALELEGNEQPALFRVHDEPSPDRLHELHELLEPFGIDLEIGAEGLHPAVLQAVLQRFAGHPEEPFISTLVLRAMKRARYEPEPLGHYALASRHYTHFTSPIRRYPDLVVHRQLRQLLEKSPAETAVATTLRERLPAIAEHTSLTEARAERAERFVLQWKVVRFLLGREGETFSGRVTGVKPYGLFIQLSDFFVDGLLPLSNMDDDFYEYRAERHELVGQSTGRTFRLADELSVILQSVDVPRRRLVLAPTRTGAQERSRGDEDGRRLG